MMKLYSVFLAVFFAGLWSNMHAGEVEKKVRAAVPLKRSMGCPLDLKRLSARLVWDISQDTMDEAHQWPFCHPKINVSLKDFQDACFGELQNLYTKWEQTQQELPAQCKEYEILVRDKAINDPVNILAVNLLWGTKTYQNIRWHVYSKIAQVYALLCAHDTPSKAIDSQLLTLDKFLELRSSLVTPSKRPRRSSSV